MHLKNLFANGLLPSNRVDCRIIFEIVCEAQGSVTKLEDGKFRQSDQSMHKEGVVTEAKIVGCLN